MFEINRVEKNYRKKQKMKLIELFESSNEYLEKFLIRIKENTDKKTIDTLLHDHLYRGIGRSSRFPFFEEEIIKDRLPSDTPLCFSEKIDDYFESRGFRVSRKNSIFATGDYRKAVPYTDNVEDDMYIIFPSKGFSFLWNPKVEDMFLSYYKFFNFNFEKLNNAPPMDKILYMRNIVDNFFSVDLDKETKETIEKIYFYYIRAKNEYEDNGKLNDSEYFFKFVEIWNNLSKNISFQEDVGKIVKFFIDYVGTPEACEYLDVDENSEIKYYTDKNLLDAIKSGNEIMITGKSYFAINFSFFEENSKFIIEKLEK